MNKETAKQNLLALINQCVKTGGIFADATSVAVMVNSIHVLDAESEQGETAMMPVNNGKADSLRAIREANSTKNS